MEASISVRGRWKSVVGIDITSAVKANGLSEVLRAASPVTADLDLAQYRLFVSHDKMSARIEVTHPDCWSDSGHEHSHEILSDGTLSNLDGVTHNWQMTVSQRDYLRGLLLACCQMSDL